MLTPIEIAVLSIFRKFLITPGQMMCFDGPEFKKFKPALRQLTEKGFLIKERFDGGYSLTRAGFEAVKSSTRR